MQFFYAPSTSTAGASDYVDIAQVQLEVGSVPSLFDFRPYQTELALCQRYYQQSYDIGVSPGTVTTTGAVITLPSATTSYAGFGTIYFKTYMRSDPTVTIY